MEFNTQVLHDRGKNEEYAAGATVPPIAQCNAFSYRTAEDLGKVFAHRAPGYAYTRIGNPTVSVFEQRVALMEGGAAGTATSSGMAAITLAILNIVSAGDEIIAGSGLYGGTISLFDDLENFGIHTRFVQHLVPEEIEQQITPRTKLIYGEVIANPALEIMDIEAVARTAHAHGIPLIVDSTAATPWITKPLAHGADIVVHSSSKYINGGSNAISGVIIDGQTFRWDPDRYPALAKWHKYGPMAYTVRLRTDILSNFGSCLAPQNAFLNVVGLETLGLRMERITDNAEKLANALAALPGITVNYPTLPGRADPALLARQMHGRGGGILTFRAGSREKALAVLDNLQYACLASNIGDIRTLALHPASTIYSYNTKEQMEAAGVWEDTIRVSVGIENIEDLVTDFTEAIRKAESSS